MERKEEFMVGAGVWRGKGAEGGGNRAHSAMKSPNGALRGGLGYVRSGILGGLGWGWRRWVRSYERGIDSTLSMTRK